MTTTTTTAPRTSCNQPCRSSTCPPWLRTTLADLEQRVQCLVLGLPEEEESYSFAERAENYYRIRPQLLALLHDLHNDYLSLAHRFCRSSHISTVHSDHIDDHDASSSYSDAESSLSFQPPPVSHTGGGDLIVAELVAQAVETELLQHELGELDRHRTESTRKIELQGSLLDVLESERMVLLGENARLGFRVVAAEEDRRNLAAELGFMRRKAGELARCVLKLREDHRVCLLGRKIEGLQSQIYGLERRNRECYEVMTRREKEKAEGVREVCGELDRLKAENRRLREETAAAAAEKRRRWPSWWGRVKGMEWGLCGCHVGEEKGSCYW